MYGLKIGEITMFLGKIPNRKQWCFYFAEGTSLIPVAYVADKSLPEAQRLWAEMTRAPSTHSK